MQQSMNCHNLSQVIQRSHSCKKILSSHPGPVLLHQTEVEQPFLILLLRKEAVIHHACMQIPHAKRTQCTTHDIQGSSAYNVSNRCVEVKEGNAPEIPVVPLPPGPLPSLKLHHTARAALPSRLNGHFYIAISHLFFSPY